MSRYKEELNLVADLIKNASKITEWFRKEGFQSFQKQDESPVTLADYASQIFIISKLKEYFPEDQIIAEEEDNVFVDKKAMEVIMECYNSLNLEKISNIKQIISYRGSPSKRQWTIDPIDGTKGFQKGLSYAIGISLMVQSELCVGAIGIPNYDERGKAIFIAEKDQGAKSSYGENEFILIKVSNQKNLKKARFLHSLHYDQPWTLKFIDMAGITDRIQMDSMGKFCKVADGTADIYLRPINYQPYSWDYCPGDLILREAGGKVTDLNGNGIKYENKRCLLPTPGFLASNGILHSEVLDIINKNNLFENI